MMSFANRPPLTGAEYAGQSLDEIEDCPEPYVGIRNIEYAAVYETCLGIEEQLRLRLSLWESWANAEIEAQQGAEHDN